MYTFYIFTITILGKKLQEITKTENFYILVYAPWEQKIFYALEHLEYYYRSFMVLGFMVDPGAYGRGKISKKLIDSTWVPMLWLSTQILCIIDLKFKLQKQWLATYMKLR